MHELPASVLDEMLEAHAMGSFIDWNFGFWGLDAAYLIPKLPEMLDQPGAVVDGVHVMVGDWSEEVESLNAAVAVLAKHRMQGSLCFRISHQGEKIFVDASTIFVDGQQSAVELVFFEDSLDLIGRPRLWDWMVRYACHAARVAGAPAILIFDGSPGEENLRRFVAGLDPACPDRVIRVDR